MILIKGRVDLIINIAYAAAADKMPRHLPARHELIDEIDDLPIPKF